MRMSRRRCLVELAAGGASLAAAGITSGLPGAPPTVLGAVASDEGIGPIVGAYLAALRRPDGGYAWEDQTTSHLTPTYAVIGSSRLIQREHPDQPKLVEFVRENHPAQWKKLEQEHREFELQQIQSLIWLGADPREFRELVAGWRKPVPYLKQYERNGVPVFRHQVVAITARKLLGMPLGDLDPSLIEYVASRRRTNGSFNNTSAGDGGDGHVMNTLWGLQALADLGQAAELRAETIAWLQQCQRVDGGFSWQPKPALSPVANVSYTWAAVKGLALLNARPKEPARAAEFLWKHFNQDGGFSDRVGWSSNPLATYYALDALSTLLSAETGSASLGSTSIRSASIRSASGRSASGRSAAGRSASTGAVLSGSLPADLKVFSIQIEAHGSGSPADAVRLAQGLRIDMWGAKNAKPGWIERAQAIADQRQVAVKFFCANEEYGSWIEVPGFGTYSHMSDIIAPDAKAATGSLASDRAVSWPEFKQRLIGPLLRTGGRMVWQFGENEELVRLLLDDSLSGDGPQGAAKEGYAMISTFHFGNPDFTNTEPFLEHYRGQIPFVALQDAHGPEPWWFGDMTSGFRTLFLAREATWQSWLEALEKRWTVAVRYDEQSRGRLLHHAGAPEVLDFVMQRQQQWQWWDNAAIARPMVSLVALRPDDSWETGKPERGINLRVRCAWSNTAQGQPKEPLAELVSLMVDGQRVEPLKQTAHGGRNPKLRSDEFYIWTIPEATATDHHAVATVRVLANGRLESQSIDF